MTALSSSPPCLRRAPLFVVAKHDVALIEPCTAAYVEWEHGMPYAQANGVGSHGRPFLRCMLLHGGLWDGVMIGVSKHLLTNHPCKIYVP